jgi:hypothetical protein
MNRDFALLKRGIRRWVSPIDRDFAALNRGDREKEGVVYFFGKLLRGVEDFGIRGFSFIEFFGNRCL